MKIPQFTNQRFDLGDLVKIKPLYHLDYLTGDLAMVKEHYGSDPSDPTGEYFYEVDIPAIKGSMILKHSELELVSKGRKKKE